jgi:hypothetical protein
MTGTLLCIMLRKKAITYVTLISLSLIMFLSIANAKLAYADEGATCTDCVQEQITTSNNIGLALRYSYNLRGGYVANGTGMRNFGYGTITIQGVPVGSVVKRALLYWSVGDIPSAPNVEKGIFRGIPITGILVGRSYEPCWLETTANASVFYADVTAHIAQPINGAYSLKGFASGMTDGSDPWEVDPIPPLCQGASLVIIYCNENLPSRTIQVYDGAVTVPDAVVTAETALGGFIASATPNAITTYIVADGQLGNDDGLWNGAIVVDDFSGNDVVDNTGIRGYFSDGGLWDTITVPVTVLPGETSATAAVESKGDCLTWGAQVFQVETDEPVEACPSQVVGGELTIPSFTLTSMLVVALAGISLIILALKVPKKLVKAN